jgi:hypothetical protein
MDTLEYDPKTKQNIKNALYEYLYGPVKKQLESTVESIVIRNTLMGGYDHRHFVYKGVLYNCEATMPPLRKNRLLPALRDSMEEYLRELDTLNNKELPFVLNFLSQVLNSSSDIGDYMKVLPESIHPPLNSLMATCPCRGNSLDPERAAQMVKKNEEIIHMIKRRLVTNLLI